MSESEPVMQKRAVRMPDGRRLLFYDFPEPACRPEDGLAPPPGAPRPAPAAGDAGHGKER